MPELSPNPSESEPVTSPPPAPRPAETQTDPRGDLLRLAELLRHSRSGRLLTEYLRLRRALRS